jgi:hypothetical protein
MQQDFFPLCDITTHEKICSMACLALSSGIKSIHSKEDEDDNEFGALFVGTNDGFLLRYCYVVPMDMVWTNPLHSKAKIDDYFPRSFLHVERNVGVTRQPVTQIRICPGTKSIYLNSQADFLAPCFEGSMVGALCGGGVYLYREEDLHPLVGLSKPLIDNAVSFAFNSRRGIDGGICIEKGNRLNFYFLAQLLVEDPAARTPFHQMKLAEPLKDMLWLDDRLALSFRTGCVIARLSAADPSGGIALLRVDAAAGDVPSLHPLPHGEFLVVCGREGRAFDLCGQASRRHGPRPYQLRLETRTCACMRAEKNPHARARTHAHAHAHAHPQAHTQHTSARARTHAIAQ